MTCKQENNQLPVSARRIGYFVRSRQRYDTDETTFEVQSRYWMCLIDYQEPPWSPRANIPSDFILRSTIH